MSEILFIRHAETDMAGTFCGHSDPDLNAVGRVQLDELIGRLRAEEIAAVYTSDLSRAHTTGLAIAEAFGVDCYRRSALREINFGQWEGLTWDEIERRDSAYAHRWLAEYPRVSAPNGECYFDFERRVLDEVELLSTKVIGKRVAVVTHAGVLRTVLRAFHGHSDSDAWMQTKSYCSIVRHNCMSFVRNGEVGS
jgi:alpha-ribazole phosphatase/probable phosphoglycerate mutase